MNGPIFIYRYFNVLKYFSKEIFCMFGQYGTCEEYISEFESTRQATKKEKLLRTYCDLDMQKTYKRISK